MAKKTIKINTVGDYGEYYHLLSEKKSIFGAIAYALYFPVIKPIRALQFLFGRLLSYVILNPLFRKVEHENTALTKNEKYPDPYISELDDMVIVNVLPEVGFIKRSIKNWLNQLKSSIMNSPFVPLADEEVAQQGFSNQARIHQLMGQVASLINGVTLPGQVAVSKNFQPEQIHFRGLHHLSPEIRALFFENIAQTHQYDFSENSKKYKFFTLKNRSGAELDSVEICGNSVQSQPIEDRKFIVVCLPRSNNYNDWLKEHRFYADQLNTTVVAFNYRGTGQGTGIISSQRGMRHDAIAQVERLIALGANPENIGLMGECLGGNIATSAAAALHQQNYKVKLFNARSFRSSSSLFLDKVLPEKNANRLNPLNWGRWLLAGLSMITIVPLLYLVNWDLSIDNAFKSIPVEDRDFLVVRSKKDENGQRYRDDAMIPHAHASLYSLVKEEQQRLQRKKDFGDTISHEEQAWLDDNRGSHKYHVDEEQRSDARTANGHICQLRYLTKTKQNVASDDGREYVLKFFGKVLNHQVEPVNSDELPDIQARV